jgi:hypothetical protein
MRSVKRLNRIDYSEDLRKNFTVQERGHIMHARVTKLEAVIATLATREDLARLEVTLHREISGIQREVSGIHRDITHIHQTVSAQTWKILSTLIATSTLLVGVTYYLAKHVG